MFDRDDRVFERGNVASCRVLAELNVLEAALKAGNNEEAAKAVEELGKLQKSDHKEFRRPPAKK